MYINSLTHSQKKRLQNRSLFVLHRYFEGLNIKCNSYEQPTTSENKAFNLICCAIQTCSSLISSKKTYEKHVFTLK